MRRALRSVALVMSFEILELLERVYAAATEQGGWNVLLRRLAALTDCVAAGITIEDPTTRKGIPITYFGFDAGHVEKTFDHYLPANPLFAIAPSMTTGFIVANGDVIAPEAFVMTDFYNGWARPQGIGSPLTLVLDHGDAFYCPLTLVRPDGKGEASSADRRLLRTLSPHLTRAMKVHRKLENADARLMADDALFENAGLAVFLLDALGHVSFCNRKAEQLLRDGAVLTARGATLRASNAGDDRRLQNALARALARPAPSGAELTIAGGGQRVLSVSVTPMPPSTTARFHVGARPICAVVVGDPDTRLRSTVDRMAQVHRLTPAETRVLHIVLTGLGAGEAADNLGVSVETARTHLKRILSKTGTTRQAELMRLFMDAALRSRL
jgi:DNA-binding CsgD family transcriptional regulator